MDKKVNFVELTKMNTSNNVHNESFENKTPKKKMYDGSSTGLNTYTEEKTCEKYIEQNITDSYSRKNGSQKEKSEINTSADISLGNNCSMDNENVLIKKPKKKRNHNKSLNLMHTNTNHDTEIFNRMCEEVNEQTINDSDYRENVNQIVKSELNALSDSTLENICSMDNDNVATKKPKKKKKHKTSLNSIEINTYNDADYRIYEKDNKHNINDPESTENKTKIKMSEINALTTKKPKKKKKHNTSLNTTTEAAIKSFDRTFVEVNEQNIIDSYSRKNASRKRKSEINALADISLGDGCSIDNENVPTKKTKKKKNHDENLNSIEFNTNHETKLQIIERTYEVFNDQNINKSDFRENVNRLLKSELNASSEISSENKCSMDYDNVAIKKSKKKKNHVRSLNSIELNTYNDVVKDSDYIKNISQKRMSEINALPTPKTPKKKKNHSKNINLIELNTNHDTEIQIFERTYDEINDSYYRENVKQITMPELNTSSDILSENKLSMDNDNVTTMKPKKKKKRNKSFNSIELNTNNDAHFRTFEKNNEHNINDSDSTIYTSQKRMSELNTLADISLGNDFSNDNENVPTKIPKKKKNHNKSLNLIELNTNNDAHFRIYEKNNEHNINDSDSTKYTSQKRMSELNTLADISLGNDFSNDNENVPTKIPKKKKNHNKSFNSIELNTNNDTHFRIYEKNNEHNINDSDSTGNISQKEMSGLNTLVDISLGSDFSNDNENVPTKIPKKKKNHNKSLNSAELNTNNDAHFRTCEKLNEHNINVSDSTGNISQKEMSELNTLVDISLGSDFSNDNENVPTKIPKKKKNHNKSLNSTELNTNNDAYFRTCEKLNEHNINVSDSTGNISQKEMSELNALPDISLGNDFNNDNENVPTKKPKKKRIHNKSLNLITNINHDTEIFERMCEEVSEPNMNNSDTKALASASLEINYSLDNEHLVTKESEKRKKHDKIPNNLSMPVISQSQSRLKTLLNSMELYNFEESSTNNTNLNLKRFNLMKYLTNKDPSLKNHPNFKQINEHLSKKIKLTINKKCELKAPDILLLKTIGKIILKKIVEKIDSAQDIKDLVIKLPPECMENKIHFIETTLSRLPNKSKMDIIKKHNPLIKLRVFNKDEDNMIREYWSKFQKEYNISNIQPFLSNGLEIALSPTERLQFIRYISAGLPNRLLYSVFNRFNILFNEYQDKTCFSEEEDQLIIKVDKCEAIKNKFSVLSLILNRTRLQLYRRHTVLKNQHKECEIFKWDDQKRQELLTNILLETNTEHWTHLKNMTITKDILIKIAKNLGKNITYDKVRYQWNHLYTMLFCEKPILMSTFNLIVLELLEQINPKHWSDLNWIEITNKLYPGAKSKVICGFFHSWIDKKVPSDIKKNVRDTILYLKQHEVDKLQRRIDKHGEREFPRFTVSDYDLLVNNQ